MLYLNKFIKLTLVSKFFVCFFIFAAYAAILSAAWIGMFISLGIAFLILQFAGRYNAHQFNSNTDLQDDEQHHIQQQQLDDDHMARVAEEERLEQENTSNQEGLDRLL